MIIFLPQHPFPFLLFTDTADRPPEVSDAVSPPPGPDDVPVPPGPEVEPTSPSGSAPLDETVTGVRETAAPADKLLPR